MSDEPKRGQISLIGANPMAISELSGEQDLEAVDEEQRALARAAGDAISGYVKAAKSLLAGKLAHLKSLAPPHLADPGNVLVACCPDGIVIRYETKSDSPGRVIGAWMPEALPEVAANLSQKLVRVRQSPATDATVDDFGIELQLFTTSGDTGENTILSTARVFFDVVLADPPATPGPGSKPFCLLSVRNTFHFHIYGQLVPNDPNRGTGQFFLAQSVARLPVGWDCIEVFPSVDPANWQRDFAPAWAENDILAAVVSRQFQEAQLNSLDHNAEARRRISKLLEEFRKLLDTEPRHEEVLQRFLGANPALLCPAHISVWPKLALGANVTDFVFREAAGDYLLVELEKSIDRLFVKSGDQSHQLTHARGQIRDWRRYLEDNLSTVQRELGLEAISASPRSLIVMGRSKDVSRENRRKLTAIENEAPRLKISTYDDVLENAKAVFENLFGPLWNVEGNTRIYYMPSGSSGSKA